MTKLPFIALTALVAAAGIAAPALAAIPANTDVKVPYCANSSDSTIDAQKDALAIQLQLSTKAGSSIDEWNGCLQVTTLVNGKAVTAYYDPDTLKQVAKFG